MRDEYNGSWLIRLTALAVGAFGFGEAIFLVDLMVKRAHSSYPMPFPVLITAGVFMLAMLAIGLLGLFGIASSMSRYVITEEGIEQIRRSSCLHMLWSEVVSAEVDYAMGPVIHLIDAAGRKMTIRPEWLASGKVLQSEIATCLSEVIQRQRAQSVRDGSFRPARINAYVVIVGGVFFCGIGLPFIPGMDSTPANFWAGLAMVAIVLVPGLLLLAYGIYLYTWRLTLTDEAIESTSVFGCKVIRYDEIDSLLIRDVQTKNGVVNTTRVESPAGKLYLSASMKGYEAIRDAIQERTSAAAVQRGTASVPARKKREAKQMLVFISVVSLIGVGGCGLYFLSSARNALHRADALDSRGSTAAGVVTGVREVQGDKAVFYYVDFTYTVGDHTYQRASPIARTRYREVGSGQPISVNYLPEDPGIARASISIGRSAAARQLRFAELVLALAAGLPVYASFLFKRRLKAEIRSLSQKSPSA